VSKRKTLLVSISFPPKKDSEALQVAKYFKQLTALNSDFEFEVLTSAIPTLNMPYEEEMEVYDSGYKNKIEIRLPESRYLNFFLRKVSPSLLQKPDSKYLFHKQSEKVRNKIKEVPNLIYSRSYPLSSAIMAYKLALHYNVPWVMHLSDPWSIYSLGQLTPRGRSWHQSWERRCFERANKICFTSRETVEEYNLIYPELRDKFEYFPNVYDASDYAPADMDWERKMRIVYTGGLIGERSLKWVIEPMKDLIRKRPELATKFVLQFCGEMDRYNRNYIDHLNAPFIENKGVLSYKESIQLQRQAHILLLVDNPAKKDSKSVFFPSKLLDYALANRKIVSVTAKESTAAEITRELSGVAFEHDDSTSLQDLLIDSITQFENRNTKHFERSELPKEFDAAHQASRLIKLFSELT